MAFHADLHVHSKYSRATSRDCDLDYFAIRRALESGEGYGGTLEFFPELCQDSGYVKCFSKLVDHARILGSALYHLAWLFRGVRYRLQGLAHTPLRLRPVSV